MNKKNMQIVVILIVVVIATVVVLGFFGVGGLNFFPQQAPAADSQAPATADQGANSAQQLLAQVQKAGSVTELMGADITVGTGDQIAIGDTIDVKYTGVLPNGTIFDSTDAHGGTPLTLVVAADGTLHLPSGGGLIAGWSQGMAGMRDGGRRLLAIPPALGYGPNGQGPIPANATLIFDVQVVKVTHPSGKAPAPAPSAKPQ